MVVIREMKSDEANRVQQLGRKAFGIVEGLFIPRPKEAIVATIDDQIVGGIIVRYLVTKDKKIGYFEDAFIDPDYQGQGIGSKLYKGTTEYLWSQGCDALSGLVKDDNVGSWQLFLNNQIKRTTFGEGVRKLGFVAMLKQYFMTPFFIANGMEFYLAVKGQETEEKKVKTSHQMSLYLLFNILLLLPALCLSTQSTITFIAAYLTLLVGGMIAGYLGTLLSKRKWKFRVNTCGGVMVALINLSGVYPLCGNWYPEVYENTTSFKRDMGHQALCEWLFIIIITVISDIWGKDSQYIQGLVHMGEIFLIYRVLNFYPFEFFGAKRVYSWRKEAYFLLSLISLGTVYML